MYQDLALLIRQLSLLTAQLQVDTDEELIDDMAEGHHEQVCHNSCLWCYWR